jgi:hypothetical protein
MLSDIAENIEDADMYKFLVQTEPDGKKMLNKEEQRAFEAYPSCRQDKNTLYLSRRQDGYDYG